MASIGICASPFLHFRASAQSEFKHSSRRREEADFDAKKFRLVTSAATTLATILELTLRRALGNVQYRGEFPLPVVRPQRGRQIPDLQRVFNQPVVLTSAGFKLDNPICFQRRNRQAVAQENAVRRARHSLRR